MYQLHFTSPVVTPISVEIIEVIKPAPPGAAYYSDEVFDTLSAAEAAKARIIRVALARWSAAGREGSPFRQWSSTGKSSPPCWALDFGFQFVAADESDEYFTVSSSAS